ncbi:SPFH domain-containing protein [Frateuria defendens]|uniref:SPFH domain-containing protein n=1 Tax=Frateuria defendens TaxID=2219559 RepID=UPI00066FD130|nr:SPFH domain-containing protein [Frateuria defendens]
MLPLTLLLVLCLAAVLAGAFRRVPAGQVHSLYRHGRLRRLLQPGVHAVLPLVDRIGHRIDLAGQVLRFQEALPDAHDVRGTVYWQVLEPERADAVLDQIEQLIRRGALDAIEAEPAAARDDRRDLGRRLKQRLNGVLRERGMMVTRVDLEFA